MVLLFARNTFGIILIIIANQCCGSPVSKSLKCQHAWLFECNLTIKSTSRALSYIEAHPESLTNDVIFGVLMARANIQWIIGRLKVSPIVNSFVSELSELMEKCDAIIDLNRTRAYPILEKRLWNNQAGDLKSGTLQLEDRNFVMPKFYSCQSINTYMMKGSPENSDFCINELFKLKCNISDYCWLSEMNKGHHSGYKTSHRLIYLQTAERLQCDKINPNKFFAIATLKKQLCQQMILEARTLHEDVNFLVTRDLFLEQIALCGFEGYEEFAEETWRKELRSWQSSDGCFGQDMKFGNCPILLPENYSKKQLKRTDSVINNCHTHVTAVAISALAFHLRFVLQQAFWSTQGHPTQFQFYD